MLPELYLKTKKQHNKFIVCFSYMCIHFFTWCCDKDVLFE